MGFGVAFVLVVGFCFFQTAAKGRAVLSPPLSVLAPGSQPWALLIFTPLAESCSMKSKTHRDKLVIVNKQQLKV